MKYEPLGFTENGITYHISTKEKMVIVVAIKGDLIIRCTGDTFKVTIAAAKKKIMKKQIKYWTKKAISNSIIMLYLFIFGKHYN